MEISTESGAVAVQTPPELNPNDQKTWSEDQRTEWNRTGKVPVPPKKPDSAPASPSESQTKPEEKSKTAAESGTAHKQEKPGKLTAEERIDQLTGRFQSEIDRLNRELAEARKPESEAKAELAKPAEPPKRPKLPDPFKLSPEEYATAMDKYEKDLDAYEQFSRQQAVFESQRNQVAQDVAKKNAEMLKEMTAKHPDAEQKIRESAKRIMELPPQQQYLKQFIHDSENLGELLYVLDQPTLEKVLEVAKTNPSKALRVLTGMEADIATALKAPKTEAKATETPAEKKPSAPPPPKEVGGRGTAPADETVEAAKANDFKRMSAEMARRHFRAS